MVSLFLNLLDLGDDIFGINSTRLIALRTTVELEFLIASQETLQRETEERRLERTKKRNLSFDLVFSDGEFHWYFQLSSSLQKRISQNKNKRLYTGNRYSEIRMYF